MIEIFGFSFQSEINLIFTSQPFRPMGYCDHQHLSNGGLNRSDVDQFWGFKKTYKLSISKVKVIHWVSTFDQLFELLKGSITCCNYTSLATMLLSQTGVAILVLSASACWSLILLKLRDMLWGDNCRTIVVLTLIS